MTTMMINKAKSKSEIADEYGISVKTLRIWLKDRGFTYRNSGLFTPLEVNRIYEMLGDPYQKRRNATMP